LERVNSSIVNTESESVVLLSDETGDAQLDIEGSMTPVFSISFRISSSASRVAKGGFLGACRIGRASPVSISCWRMEQKPMSADEVAKGMLMVNQ